MDTFGLIYIMTVSYAVMINGQPGRKIYPLRGLHQGDPLSPYLFLLCVEGLSGLLSIAEEQSQIRGIKVARGCQPINHFFFWPTPVVYFIELPLLNGNTFN